VAFLLSNFIVHSTTGCIPGAGHHWLSIATAWPWKTFLWGSSGEISFEFFLEFKMAHSGVLHKFDRRWAELLAILFKSIAIAIAILSAKNVAILFAILQ